MAIDSLEKRANVMGVARPWMRSKLPISDKDAQWRAATGHTYGGNAFAGGPVAAQGGLMLSRRRRGR